MRISLKLIDEEKKFVVEGREETAHNYFIYIYNHIFIKKIKFPDYLPKIFYIYILFDLILNPIRLYIELLGFKLLCFDRKWENIFKTSYFFIMYVCVLFFFSILL